MSASPKKDYCLPAFKVIKMTPNDIIATSNKYGHATIDDIEDGGEI